MSQENVKLVRSAIEAYIAGDHDAYVDFTAKDVEFCPDVGVPEAKPFRGREEFRRFIAYQDQSSGAQVRRKSRKSSRWVTGSWFGPTGEAGAGLAVSTCAPA